MLGFPKENSFAQMRCSEKPRIMPVKDLFWASAPLRVFSYNSSHHDRSRRRRGGHLQRLFGPPFPLKVGGWPALIVAPALEGGRVARPNDPPDSRGCPVQAPLGR